MAKFEPVDRALTETMTSVGIGVTFGDYNRHVQQFATELQLLEDRASNQNEKTALESFRPLLQEYEDALTIWQLDSDPVTIKLKSARHDYADSGIGDKEVCAEPILPILEKYMIPTQTPSGLLGLHVVNANMALRRIWLIANLVGKHSKADRLQLLTPSWLKSMDAHHLSWL